MVWENLSSMANMLKKDDVQPIMDWKTKAASMRFCGALPSLRRQAIKDRAETVWLAENEADGAAIDAGGDGAVATVAAVIERLVLLENFSMKMRVFNKSTSGGLQSSPTRPNTLR